MSMGGLWLLGYLIMTLIIVITSYYFYRKMREKKTK